MVDTQSIHTTSNVITDEFRSVTFAIRSVPSTKAGSTIVELLIANPSNLFNAALKTLIVNDILI